MPQDMIIAIDGHSGCGKSSTAKAVAKALHYTYIDSGAMYRAATLYFIRHAVDLSDAGQIEKAVQDINITFLPGKNSENFETYLNGTYVEKEIRQMAVAQQVSQVSAIPEVRRAMVAQQRALGKDKKIVMDGRDIGTNVFPEAALKIFMTAAVPVRAERRQKELLEKGQAVDLETIKKNLTARDAMDSGRKENPLQKAPGAIVIDTSCLTFQQQVDQVVALAKEIMAQS